MDVREVWFGTSFQAKAFRFFLLPASGLYWLGWKAYLALYAIGFKKSKTLPVPIIVVGNFTVGGSGKSPTVIHMAEVLMEMGYPIVIGCSGYGSPRQHGATLAPAGTLDPKQWGDEPAMIRESLPGVPIVVGRDRVAAAAIVDEARNGSILLMDDGLQHLPLACDIRIALDPPTKNRFVLPAGPYREPRSSDRVDEMFPGRFRLEYSEIVLRNPDGSLSKIDPDEQVSVLTAIGSPESFVGTLQEAGINPMRLKFLPDHDPLDAGTLFDDFEPSCTIISTQKDWIKLRNRKDLDGRSIVIASRLARIEPAAEFSDWIDEKIKKAIRANACR